MTGGRRAAVLVALLAIPALAGACTLDPNGGQSSGSATGSASESGSATQTASESGSTAPTADPSESATSSPSTSQDSGDAPPFPADTAEDTGDGTGTEVGTLVDLRVGAHEGFDRVVLELDGPDVPSWRVGYVDEPIGDPSGMRVDLKGDAYLQVILQPVAYPEDGSDPYDGSSHVAVAGTEVVTEVVLSSIFEGELQAFVGVDGGEHPFRVYGMSDPARVVIEVRTDEG